MTSVRQRCRNAVYGATTSATAVAGSQLVRAYPHAAKILTKAFADHFLLRVRQGHKLLRLGERYTGERLDAACRRALDVDLIDVNRVERILVQALEQEAMPQLPLPMPTGRFARPGSVFALTAGGRS